MILPQITYNDLDPVFNPNGGPVTLTFLYAPTSKPKFNRQATRTDTFSTAGNRQTVTQRVNQQFPLTMSNILDDGNDVPAWQRFLDFAIGGGQFVYYPDAENDVEQYVCFLTDTTAQLAYSSPGVYSLSCTMQVEIQ